MLQDGALLAPAALAALAVLDAGSFSQAARDMGVRQSTISRQIRDLEDRIGVSIFERGGQGARPTEAGHQFLGQLSQARTIIRQAIIGAHDFGAVKIGRLRLGFVGSFASSPATEILASLRRLHPGLVIQLAEVGATELIQQVIARELDCAWLPSWRSPDPVLVVEPLWREALYLAMPAHSPGRESVSWTDLARRVLLARPTAELDLLFTVLDAAGVSRPEVQVHDLSRESLVALVAGGEGVAILPESFARIDRPGVQFARINEPEAVTTVCVLYRRDRDNPALRRLLAVTRAWVREHEFNSPSPSAPG